MDEPWLANATSISPNPVPADEPWLAGATPIGSEPWLRHATSVPPPEKNRDPGFMDVVRNLPHTLPMLGKQMYEGITGMATLPKRVYTGEANLNDPATLDQAIGLGTMMSPGAVASRGRAAIPAARAESAIEDAPRQAPLDPHVPAQAGEVVRPEPTAPSEVWPGEPRPEPPAQQVRESVPSSGRAEIGAVDRLGAEKPLGSEVSNEGGLTPEQQKHFDRYIAYDPKRVRNFHARMDIAQHEDKIRSSLQEVGLSQSEIDGQYVSRAAAFMREGKERDPTAAYERAVMEAHGEDEYLHDIGMDDPRALGAQKAPPFVAGAKPGRAAIGEYENKLDKVHLKGPQHEAIQLRQRLLKDTPPEYKAAEPQQRLYTALEEGGALSPADRAYADKHLAPGRKEIKDLFVSVQAAAKKAGLTDEELEEAAGIDPNYMPRISIEHNSFLKAAEEAAPISSRNIGHAPSLEPTAYDVLVSQDGTRHVVRKSGDNLVFVGPAGVGLDSIKSGGRLKYGDAVGPWTYARGTTAEIETALGRPGMYLKDAAFAVEFTRSSLRNTLDRLHLLQELKDDPQISPFISSEQASKDWVRPGFPGFKNLFVHPRLGEMLEDFTPAAPNKIMEAVNAVNYTMVGSIFWTPIPHLRNVAGHYVMGSGWDLFNPMTLPQDMREWGQALKEVTAQGPLYRAVLKEGGPLFFARLKNAELPRQIMEAYGHQIQTNPQATGVAALAKRLGLPVRDVIKSFMRSQAGVLWWGGDVMALRLVMQKMRKTPDLRAAIEAAHDIPDYRVPSRTWEGPGGRVASKFMRFTPINVFGRYRFNVMEGLYRIGKDVAVGTPKQRLDAAGKIVALGALYEAYEWADKKIKESGRAKGMMLSRPGPMGPIKTVEEAAGGNFDKPQMQRLFGFSPSPLVDLAGGAMTGHDALGRQIARPGATRKEKAVQYADFAAEHLGPFSTATRWSGFDDSGEEGALDYLTGLRRISPPGGWESVTDSAFRSTRRVGPVEHLATGRPLGSKPKLPAALYKSKKPILEETGPLGESLR